MVQNITLDVHPIRGLNWLMHIQRQNVMCKSWNNWRPLMTSITEKSQCKVSVWRILWKSRVSEFVKSLPHKWRLIFYITCECLPESLLNLTHRTLLTLSILVSTWAVSSLLHSDNGSCFRPSSLHNCGLLVIVYLLTSCYKIVWFRTQLHFIFGIFILATSCSRDVNSTQMDQFGTRDRSHFRENVHGCGVARKQPGEPM